MNLYPLFLRLAERPVLVVGGGPVAAEKARHLVAAGAKVYVVAPELSPALRGLPVVMHERAFVADDIDGAWLVVAAAPPTVNRQVQVAAEARQRFVLAVDDREAGSAYAAATFERGGVTVALSSGGRAPALVAVLRRALEALISDDDVSAWMALAESLRTTWRASGKPLGERRRALIDAIAGLRQGDVS